MGRQQQRKGAEAERELTLLLQGKGFDTKRGGSLTYGTIPDIVGLPGIHIEVKRRESLDLPGALRQAKTDAARFMDGIPTVFHRSNRGPWIVSMGLEEWLVLYSKAVSSGQNGTKGGE